MANDAPIIYTKNWVNGDCTFIVNLADSSFPIALAYDRDNASQFKSSGANSDATQLSIEVDFDQARDVDTIILVNHNLKAITIQYWNGSSFATWGTVVGAAANTVMSATKRNTTKIKLLCSTTQVANQEKVIGEFIACAVQLAIPDGWDQANFNGRENAKKITLGDGSIHTVYSRISVNRLTKWGLQGSIWFKTSPQTNLDSLRAILEAGDVFLFYPEPDSRPDQIYLCNWNGPVKYTYKDRYSLAGYIVTLDIYEV